MTSDEDQIGCAICGTRTPNRHQCRYCGTKYGSIEDVVAHQKRRGHFGDHWLDFEYLEENDKELDILDFDIPEEEASIEKFHIQLVDDASDNDEEILFDADPEESSVVATAPAEPCVPNSSQNSNSKRDRVNDDYGARIGSLCDPLHEVWKIFRWSSATEAKCTMCTRTYQFPSHEPLHSQSGNAKRHLVKFHNVQYKSNSQPLITNWLPKSVLGSIDNPSKMSTLKLFLVRLVCEHHLPMTIAEWPIFRDMLKFLYPGFVPISRRTLRAGIFEHAEVIDLQTRSSISNSLSVNLCVDCWTGVDGRSYLAIVAQYLSPDLSLTQRLLGMPEIIRDVDGQGATAQRLADLIKQVSSKFDAFEKIQYITTDGGANIVAAISLLNKRRVPCVAHLLQLALKDYCRDSEILKKTLPLARSIAGRLRRSSAARAEIGKLRTLCVTRFDSAFHCLKSLLDHRSELMEYSGGTVELLADIRFFLMFADLIEPELNILRPAIGLSDQLSSRIGSPIFDAVPIIGMLIAQVRAMSTKSASNFVAKLEDRMQPVLHAQGIFVKAFMLNPISSDRRTYEAWLPGITNPIEFEEEFFRQYLVDEKRNSDKIVEQHAAVQQRYYLPMEDEDEIAPQYSSQNHISEWKKRPNPDEMHSTLKWWRDVGHYSWPTAAKLFHQVATVYPTEVDSERLFSVAGLVLTTRRTNLKSDFLEAILKIKVNQ